MRTHARNSTHIATYLNGAPLPVPGKRNDRRTLRPFGKTAASFTAHSSDLLLWCRCSTKLWVWSNE